MGRTAPEVYTCVESEGSALLEGWRAGRASSEERWVAERSGTHLDGLLILVHERLVDARQQVPAGHDDMRQQPVVRARTVARLVDEVGVVLVMISNCRVAAAAVRHVCGGGLTGLDEILDPRNEGGKEGGATAGGKQMGHKKLSNYGMKNGTLVYLPQVVTYFEFRCSTCLPCALPPPTHAGP